MKLTYTNEPKKKLVIYFRDLKVGDVFKAARYEINIKISTDQHANTFTRCEDSKYSGMWYWEVFTYDEELHVEKLDAELVINKAEGVL